MFLLLGVGLFIGSACVVNNYIDREIDSRMDRTKKRALVTGEIAETAALIFAALLFAFGFFMLYIGTNALTLSLGFLAVFLYVFVYGYAKRKTIYGTLVGAVPGAIPPVAGYTAFANQLDTTALLLFLILVFWQMPHFYAISIYRKKEYAAAKLPLLPLVKGIERTRIEIVVYTILFIITSLLLVPFSEAGFVYGLIMFLVGVLWLKITISKTAFGSIEKWAKKVFGFSLLVLLVFSVVLSLNWLLP
jgi:protoheme IX farnesyltransferase